MEEFEKIVESCKDKLDKLNELLTKNVDVKLEKRNGDIYHVYLEVDTCYLTGELVNDFSKVRKAILSRIEEAIYLADVYKTYLK